MKKLGKKIAASLLFIISSICLAFGVAACSPKSNNNGSDLPDFGSTDRAEVPADGSTPTQHTALENIAYMAYVLDNQPFYHAYAYNSSKSTGYEQITQTWKDYKSAELSGIGSSVMVASDLSYSTFVKSATQSCFVGDTDAYMRTGGKPSKNSVPADISWNDTAPEYYDKTSHLLKYGQFSTELSVFVINEETLISAGDVIDNGNGTYSQTFNLNADAACYYQYGMKTRGSLRDFPVFSKIEITFTFDGKWQVLSSVCNESSSIKPGALGGIPMDSTAYTETVYDYSLAGFGNDNYAYFDGYFKDYLGKTTSGGVYEETPEILDVLGGGFSKVVDPVNGGQQFTVDLTLGETYYKGKIYLKLTDFSDILGSLEVRMELGREDGKQDLYIEFVNGKLNVYYSDGFALTADVDKLSGSIGKLTEWINGFGKVEAQDVAAAINEAAESDGLDLGSLLTALELTYDDTSACIKLKTNDLLGLGIGLNVQMYFGRTKEETGSTYSFSGLYLNSVSYNSQAINLSGMIFPDDNSPVISRNPSDTPADLADYLDGITNLLDGNSYLVSINLDGSAELEYINGLELSATAQVQLKEGYNRISVNLPMEISYRGLNVNLSAYYSVNLSDGGYGDVYLALTQIGNKQVDVKIRCNVADLIDEIKAVLNYFNNGGEVLTLSAENEEAENTIANIINAVLALDFGELITELKAGDENISLSVNVDKILGVLDLDLGMSFGTLKLELTLENGKAVVSGALSGLGLTASVSGSDKQITAPDPEDYADAVTYIKAVENLLASNVYTVNFTLDGTVNTDNAVAKYLEGLKANGSAQVQLGEGFKKITVYLPLTVEYSGLSVSLEAYYTVNLESGDYGEVYLILTEINGKQFSAKVRCDISELKESIEILISEINGEASGVSALSEDSEKTAAVIDKIISLDFAKLINELTANGSGLVLSLNADEILGLLNFNLNGIEIGSVSLALGIEDGIATLTGNVPEFGITLTLGGCEGEITLPEDKGNYLDLVELARLVTAAYEEADKIINAQDINFSLEATVTVDGVEMSVTANGEVIWNNGAIRVAVAAELIISDTSDESGEKFNTVSLNFIYDDSQEKFIRLTVNGLGLEINKTDIENVKGGVTEIISSVNNLIGLFTAPEDGEDGLIAPDGANAMSLIGEDGVYAQLLNAVLSVVGDITVSLDKELIINYATHGSLSLSADGGLGLDLSVNVNGGEAVALTAFVQAGNGSALATLNGKLDGGDYTFYTDENSFERAVYEFIFGVFEDLTVDKVLGGGTYTVKVNLDGTASGISALEGIAVTANLYYTDKNVSNGKKLVQADLNLDISGTAVKAVAYFTDKTLYIELNEVAGTVLSDIAFKASADDIYSAAETLVKIISSDTLLQIISKLTGNTVQAQAAAARLSSEAQTSSSLTDMLTYILSLDFSSVITYEKVGAENVYTITPDSLLEAFGTDIKVGTVILQVNPESHAIYASVQNGIEVWLTLDAEPVSNSQYGTFSPDSKFIDIGFVANLLEDVLATLESLKDEDGNVQILYSLSGTIKADISYSVISGSVSFNNAVLTVGLDEDEDFYFSLTATLPDSKAKLNVGLSISTVNITSAGSISITYSNGYLTFGRDGVYRVMTLDYLLDYALDYTKNGFLSYSNNSPVAWLLGTNSLAWGLVCENIPVSLESGLTTPHTIGLYELAEATKENSEFSLSKILNGFEVNADGKKTNYKTCNAVSEIRSKLGLSGNYYAFDINANTLTGGVISTLYAAILSGENGVNGLKALANVGGAVDLSVNFTGRSATAAPNFYKTVISEHEINLEYSQSIGDHKTNVFGCYDTSKSGEAAYSYTTVLDTVVLNVIDFNGEVETYELRYGSTVYLTSLWAPEWTGDGKTYRVIYTDVNGNEVGTAYADSEGNILGKLLVLDDALFGSSEGTHEYTLVIEKAESNIPEKEIVFHVYGIDGIDEVRAAFEVNGGIVSLIKYKLDGYSLLEWYTDEACTEALTDDIAKAFTGSEVYCIYVKDTTTINGVIYKFYEENGEHVYHVNGYVDSGIISYTEGKTLVLENEIVLGGISYKVTAIDENAFAEAGLKNVVVPENVTLVGENAFLDNYAIQTVVFLAPSVGFKGYSDDKNYPFYGCSEVEGGETTILKLYYTEIFSVRGQGVNGENNPYWSHFRSVTSTKLRYIGNDGGARISENWAYIDFELNRFSTELTELTSGATTYAYTAEHIVSYVTGVLNSLTYAEGYVNAYSVEVSGGVALNNSRYTITITITDLPASEWWYAFTAVSAVPECAVSYVLPEGQYIEYNGITFVKAGAEISVVSTGDSYGIFEFDGWTGADTFFNAGSCETTLTMPAAKTDISATWSAEFAENVYITSEVAFYYNGVYYNAGSEMNLNNAAVHTTLANPVAAGNYAFLGWATQNGGTLNFINGAETVISEAEAHYYAVWAANHLDDAEYGVTTSGNAPLAPSVKAGYDGAFYKWYKDAAFTQEITDFTVSDTLLYARMQYSFKYSLSGNGDTYFYDNVQGDDASLTKNNCTTYGNSYSNTITVLEGVKVSFSFENDNHTVILTIGDQTIILRAKKRGGWSITNAYAAGELRTFDSGVVSLTGNGWNNTSVTVSSNISFDVPF